MNANRFLYLLAATFVFCDIQVSVSVAQTNYGQGCNPGYIKVNGQCVSASSGAGKMAAIDAQRGSPPTQPMPTSNRSGAAQCGYPNTWNGSACIPPKPTQTVPTSNAASAPPRPATPTPNQTFNPYKNLYTVQGWEQARRQNPNAQEDPNSSPYAVAARGQEVSDANGNFVTGIDLGDKVQRGQRVYKRVAVKQINGRTVSSYIEACPPGANPATCRELGQPTL